MTPTPPADPKICATCRQGLDARIDRDTGELAYIHGPQDADHEPQPIDRPDDWLGRCDFCNGGIPAYVLPVRPFNMDLPGAPDAHSSADDWATCADCAPLIERNEWGAILRRAADGFERTSGLPMTEPEKAVMRQLHRQVRKNTTGPLKPLGEAR